MRDGNFPSGIGEGTGIFLSNCTARLPGDQTSGRLRGGGEAPGKSCTASRHVRAVEQNGEPRARGSQTPGAGLGEKGERWQSQGTALDTPARREGPGPISRASPPAALPFRSEPGGEVPYPPPPPGPSSSLDGEKVPEPSPRWCREGAGTGGLQHEEGVEKEPKTPALFLAPPQAAVGAHSRTPGAERGRAGVAERRLCRRRGSPPHSLGVYKTGSGTPMKELRLPTP